MWRTNEGDRSGLRGEFSLGNTGHPTLALPTGKERWETCEIHYTEGFRGGDFKVRCHWFYARAENPQGTYTAGSSTGFWCPNWIPEPEHGGQQLETLVSLLREDGWARVDEPGRAWWQLKFRRRLRVV